MLLIWCLPSNCSYLSCVDCCAAAPVPQCSALAELAVRCAVLLRCSFVASCRPSPLPLLSSFPRCRRRSHRAEAAQCPRRPVVGPQRGPCSRVGRRPQCPPVVQRALHCAAALRTQWPRSALGRCGAVFAHAQEQTHSYRTDTSIVEAQASHKTEQRQRMRGM